jgi:uncharacterized protein involved in exopolysaccharide biosynthesis
MNTPEKAERAESLTDLHVLIVKVRARIAWVVLSVVLATAIFATAAFKITPVYRATAVLISASEERNSISGSLSSALGQLGGLAALAGVSVASGDAATQEALAVLRSRQFTEAFIADMKLAPLLFSAAWDSSTGQWKPDKPPPTAARAYKAFSATRRVSLDSRSGLVTLQVDWTDPEKAAEWANELSERLNAEMRARAIQKADASLKFLQAELATTGAVETRDAINRLVEAQVRQRMLANVTQEYSFRVVDKAMAPDRDDPVRPNKFLLIVLGPLVGLLVGLVLVLAFDLLRPSPRRAATR